jgi:hypothetical protein
MGGPRIRKTAETVRSRRTEAQDAPATTGANGSELLLNQRLAEGLSRGLPAMPQRAGFPSPYLAVRRVLCAETHRQLPSRSTQTSV